ncbi:MAG: hypothetical protein ACRDTD_16265 [Pseudonocardiaceae bacterium]
MSGTHGHRGPGADAAVAAARPVVLVRYRPGVVGETARTVHVVPRCPPTGSRARSARCAAPP